jgi:hypothetical protein
MVNLINKLKLQFNKEINMAKKTKQITNGKDVKLTFKKFWNTSELNNDIVDAIKKDNKEKLIKLMKIHSLGANYSINMEDTAIPILTYATMLGSGTIAHWLMSKEEVNLNVGDGSALEHAIATSNIGLLHSLLRYGANANNGKGKLLLLAAKKNLLDAIEELVNHGARIDKKLKQQLFDIAHRNDNYDMMRFISDKISAIL